MAALLLAEGGILFDLGINIQVVIAQALIFFATFVILRKLLFARVMKFMTDREAEAERQAAKIRVDLAEAEKLTKEYEAHIARIDKEAWERLQGVLKEALEARAKIAAEAQVRASQEAKNALAAITREKAAAMDALRKEVSTMTRQSIERVIGVPVEEGALEAALKSSTGGGTP